MISDRALRFGLVAVIVAILVLPLLAPSGWWFTPDQRGQRFLDQGDYEAAAEHFVSPLRRGVALFRSGQFPEAALAFERLDSAHGHFNRGNALVMSGKYDDAVVAYEQALAKEPGWDAASTNLEIARLRAEQIRQEGGESTGGQLEADEIVFGDEPGSDSGESVIVEAGELSEQELQSLWLRRVQTRPADFLRAKFAFQLTQPSEQEASP